MEGTLEEDLEPPGFPPKAPPVCLFYTILTDNAVGGSNPEGFIFFSSRYHLEAGGKNLEPPGFVNSLIARKITLSNRMGI